ncbi:uncharacterized protein LOC142348630 isoform X2 [Convolutriloba macropyga]|uniref:uncharacterized protein LOC142348630 isoform X2 n=1 Tax=Convolutriloba macropyga TaxID=536237 RepID=UPI003F523025
MTSSQTGIPQQDLLSEPFFQEIMNELEEPVNEETLEKQQRKYRAMKNDLYVFYHEGKQTLLKQIKEMSRLLEDRRHFRQLVIDRARKDPKRVEFERRYMKLLLDEIDDINQQIDLEQEKHVVLDEELELQKRQIWEIEKQTGGFEEYDRELVREGDVLKKRLHTLQSTYNEKLGKIIQYKEEILGFELEHKEYMDKARVLEVQLQVCIIIIE